jgi:hypothetical protein
MMITARVIVVISKDIDSIYTILVSIINIAEMVHVTLSLLVNFFATSIIALKAWCVPVPATLKDISLTAP